MYLPKWTTTTYSVTCVDKAKVFNKTCLALNPSPMTSSGEMRKEILPILYPEDKFHMPQRCFAQADYRFYDYVLKQGVLMDFEATAHAKDYI